MTDPIAIAEAVRSACVRAALDGYEQAQIAGLCQEGAWEVAVDAIRMINLKKILRQTAPEGLSAELLPPLIEPERCCAHAPHTDA